MHPRKSSEPSPSPSSPRARSSPWTPKGKAGPSGQTLCISFCGARPRAGIYKPWLPPTLPDQTGLLESPAPSVFSSCFFFQRESEPEQSQVNPESNPLIDNCSPLTAKASEVQKHLCLPYPPPRGTNPFMAGRKQRGCGRRAVGSQRHLLRTGPGWRPSQGGT